MATTLRRVVTGHDSSGRAVVKIDETRELESAGRAGTTRRVVWTTESFPVNNSREEDTSTRDVATTLANGTIFRIVEFGAGGTPRLHRTDSIDYAVVMSGEIDMELDQDSVHLKAGDVLVQRGTVHNWVNKGTEPCMIAFVLIDAKPVTVDGKTLTAHG